MARLTGLVDCPFCRCHRDIFLIVAVVTEAHRNVGALFDSAHMARVHRNGTELYRTKFGRQAKSPTLEQVCAFLNSAC